MLKLRSQKGFIAIVAIGMFVVLGLFAIITQVAVLDTNQSLRNTDNFYTAQDLADSIVENLQAEVNDHEAGFTGLSACEYDKDGVAGPTVFADVKWGTNTDIATTAANETQVCTPGTDCDSQGDSTPTDATIEPTAGGNIALCPSLDNFLGASQVNESKEVQVLLEVKGRSLAEESIKVDGCPGGIGDSNCYLVPHPGTGDAGDKCEIYAPVFAASGSSDLVPAVTTGTSDSGEADAVTKQALSTFKHINHPCNWGKLTFGSNLTDRVAIPMYYEGETDDDGDDKLDLVHPFMSTVNGGEGNQLFLLRLRTPCLPCAETGDAPETGVTRSCDPGQDPNVCTAAERYELKTDDGDDIVVQWQLDGMCPVEEGGVVTMEKCGLVAEPISIGFLGQQFGSEIIESIINAKITNSNYSVLKNTSTALDSNTNQSALISDFLEEATKPKLKLVLANKLLSTATTPKNVPYLEYQVVSEAPISSEKTGITAIINVNGNIVKKDIKVHNQRDLIDFGLQN